MDSDLTISDTSIVLNVSNVKKLSNITYYRMYVGLQDLIVFKVVRRTSN